MPEFVIVDHHRSRVRYRVQARTARHAVEHLARHGHSLMDCDLRNTNLDGASLRGADFRGADLAGASLNRAMLVGAKFCWAHMTGASLAGADMRGADLKEAFLIDTLFLNAKLAGCRVNWQWSAVPTELLRRSHADPSFARILAMGDALKLPHAADDQPFDWWRRMHQAEAWPDDRALAAIGRHIRPTDNAPGMMRRLCCDVLNGRMG